MPLTDPSGSGLILAVGLQSRRVSQIEESDSVLASAMLLLGSAKLIDRPAILAELPHADFGETVASLNPYGQMRISTDTFDATLSPSFSAQVPPAVSEILLLGVDAHDTVMQTALGLLRMGKSVTVATDAVGSRRALDKRVALARLAERGAEIVTVEMILYEWLGSVNAHNFSTIAALIAKTRAKAKRVRPAAMDTGSNRKDFDLRQEPDGAPIEIGTLLRRTRMARGYTLNEVSVRSRCSQSQLSKIENNKALPSLPLLQRLSDVLGKDIKSFLGR